jgi:thiol-disulfide isomerase/thioredoxin
MVRTLAILMISFLFSVFVTGAGTSVVLAADETDSEISAETSIEVPTEAPADVSAFDETVSVKAYQFYGEGCPHCAKELIFLKELHAEYPQLEIIEYEVYYNQNNKQLMKNVALELKTQVGGVPFLVIGDQHFIGFAEGLTDQQIRQQVESCLQTACPDRVAEVITPEGTALGESESEIQEKPGMSIQLPLLGMVNISAWSLPVLTFVFAFLDGFNPCAMWTLLFLISLLLGLKDRKRMWALGVAFIAASALVYFLFLAAWLNLFLFLGFVVWIRVLIGLVALAAGWYYLKDFWVNKEAACSVTGSEKRQKIFAQLRDITHKEQFFLALGGIVLLAVAVNTVELVCSAGLPAIYTNILSLAELPRWQYYLYLVFYIFIFMLDDLVVFFTAMLTLQATGIQSKYARYSHLIGGVLMVVIGLLLLVKPEWLMFG